MNVSGALKPARHESASTRHALQIRLVAWMIRDSEVFSETMLQIRFRLPARTERLWFGRSNSFGWDNRSESKFPVERGASSRRERCARDVFVIGDCSGRWFDSRHFRDKRFADLSSDIVHRHERFNRCHEFCRIDHKRCPGQSDRFHVDSGWNGDGELRNKRVFPDTTQRQVGVSSG